MFEDIKDLKNELQNIIQGKVSSGNDQLVQAVKAHLETGTRTSGHTEEKQPVRAIEERALINFAEANNLWVPADTFGEYVTEGAEQRVYFPVNADYVVKVADAIFYATWIDYFNNLLIHNFLFPDTAYTLIGFYLNDEKFYAVLKQLFIKSTQPTDLSAVREFMLSNGFLHKRNNDYFHPFLGIIIEDLHDENVLTNSGVLFFVDTVFYITDAFYL